MYSGPQHGAPCLYQDDGTRPHLRLAFNTSVVSPEIGGIGGEWGTTVFIFTYLLILIEVHDYEVPTLNN